MLAAPIWVRLFGLPVEFWDPEIMEGIGNTMGAFVKVVESTKIGKYTSYARLCVYMNIAEPLPEYMELEYHDEIWQQPIDYEHIPFRCRRCHEYGHLYKQCPINKEEEIIRQQEAEKRKAGRTEEEEKGFQQVNRRKKSGNKGIKIQTQTKPVDIESHNKFKTLQQDNEEKEDKIVEEDGAEDEPMEIVKEGKDKDTAKVGETKEGIGEKVEIIKEQVQMETETPKGNEVEEERIMRKLIQEWKNLDEIFIPEAQKQLYKEAFQKYKEKRGKILDNQIGIAGVQENNSMVMDSTSKGNGKIGRKMMNETIQTVGEILVNSGKVIPLSEVFHQPPKKF